ncbi:MAG: hypothetical protein LBN07_04360 [Christensenellaceae bacterium]|jgi:hypothetical protein|nr:hypothetical protein [Christensenellaceae bacterium]
MKKLLTILVVMLVGVSGLLLYGCGDKYANLSIEVRSVAELNSEGVLVMYVGDEPQEVNITVKNAPGGFNFVPLISMTNPIVSVEEDTRISGNVVTKKIVALEPGKTIVSFITSEGDKRASLNIRVIKRAESISFKNQSNVAAIENGLGSIIKLGIDNLTIMPQNSNQRDISFTIPTPVSGVSLNADGTLEITGSVSASFVDVKATVMENGNPVMNGTNEVSAIGRIDIVRAMNSKLFIAGSTDKLISEGSASGDIMLVKNMQTLNTIRVKLDIETHGQAVTVNYPTSSTEPVDVNLISVTDYNSGANRVYVFDISAIRYSGSYLLNFKVELSNYVGRFKNYGTAVNVTCDSLIRDFSVNNVIKTQEPQYFHDIDVYIGDNNGTTFRLKVADPADIPTANNRFFMELYKYNGSIYELVPNPTDMFDFWMRNTQLSHQNGILGVSNGTGVDAISSSSGADLRVRVKHPSITITDNYMIKIVAERPAAEEKYQDLIDYYNNKYSDSMSVGQLRAYTQVKLNMFKGITSIDGFEYTSPDSIGDGTWSWQTGMGTGALNSAGINVNMDLVGQHEIEIFVGPYDARNRTIQAYSSVANIVDVEVDYSGTNAVLILHPYNVGSAIIYVSSTTMLASEYKTIAINVFKPIDNVFVGLSGYDTSNVGNVVYQNIGGQNTLEEVTIKVNKTVRLEYYTDPAKAEIKNIQYEVYKYTKFANDSINPASGVLLSLGSDGKYSFKETVQNIPNVTVFEFDPATRGFYITPSTWSVDATPYVYKVLVTFFDYANNPTVQEFFIRGYVPIERINITATTNIIYNPEFLGYEDITLGKHSTVLELTVLPSNATFKFDPSGFDAFVVHEGGSSANSSMLSWTDLGLNRFEFSVNMGYTISSDRMAYIVAKVEEFGVPRYGNIGILVKNPIVVTGIAAENVIDSEIIFKMGISSPFTLDITVLPLDAFNRGVELLQFVNTGTIQNPVWVRVDENINPGSRVFAVSGLTITPIKAGQARLVVVPKDKIKNANFDYDWNKVLDIFVDVTDGSIDHPYYVSSLQELKDIGLSSDTMNKYYVLTRDIAFGALEPIGLSINTAFTGGLSGKYTRTRGEQYYTNYNSIKSIVFSTVTSNVEYLGLFYRLEDSGIPQTVTNEQSSFYEYSGTGSSERGVVYDLTIGYQHIQATFNGTQLVFGGTAAINESGTLRNVVVEYPAEGATGFAVNFITTAGTPFTFGGLVGENRGVVTLDDQTKVGVVGKITAQTGDPINYIGGVAGLNAGNIIGVYSDVDESNIQINFGNAGYTSNLNIVATATGGLSALNMGLGGIAGKNTGLLNGVASNGKITSNFNFVGGVAGQSINDGITITDTEIFGVPTAMDNVIKNSFSSSIISGDYYVGGLVGNANSTYIYGSSAENYKSFGRTNANRAFVTGNNYVGGLAGRAESADISYSYVVSYFDDNASFDILNNAAGYAGGFAGEMQGGTFSHVAVFANVSGSTRGGFVGSHLGGTAVNYLMVKAYGPTQLTGSGALSPTYGYHELNGGAVVTYTYADINAVEADTANWGINALVNDGLPYLKSRSGILPLFATNPLSVDAIVWGMLGANNGIFTKTDTRSLILFFSASTEISEKQLNRENNIDVGSFADVSVVPLTIRSSRVEVTSSNSAVISVNQNGTLQLNGVGDIVLTISSRLNASFSVQLEISVKHGINGFALYKNANRTEADKLSSDSSLQVKTLSMLTNTTQTLYSDTEFKKNIEGTIYNLVSTKEVGVRYYVYTDDDVLLETGTQNGGIGIADIFRINNLPWQVDTEISSGKNYWYVDLSFSSTSTIYALHKTEAVLDTAINGIRVYAKPYITQNISGGNKTVLIDLSAEFELNIYNGATAIRFGASISSVTMTQLDTYILAVTMDTDADEDEFTDAVAVLTGQASNVTFSDLKIERSAVEEIRDGSLQLIGKKRIYTITFVNKTTLIEMNRYYVLDFASSINPEVKISLNLAVKPQPIISADMSLYTEMHDKETQTAKTYIEEDGKASIVYNEVPAIMKLDVYPNFSFYDSFTITYTSDAGSNAMTIAQMAYDKLSNTFSPHSDYSSVAIQNGLKISKQSGADSPISPLPGLYSYSKIYYFSLLVANTKQVPDFSNFNVRVTFYKDGVIVDPRDVTYSFVNISEPIVTLDIANRALNRNVPVGTKQEMTVNIRNFDGVPEFSIEKIFWEGNEFDIINLSTLNPQVLALIMPKYEDGKYYITIPAGTVTSDGKSLAGTTIRYKAVATKEQNLKREQILDVYVTEYTITGIKISNTETVADRQKLNLVIRERTKLNIEVGVVASDTNMICANGKTVEANIQDLTDAINKAGAGDPAAGGSVNDGVWWYYDNTGAIQPLYDNHTGELYNGVFNFMPSADNNSKSVYGEKVEIPTTIELNVKLNYNGGRPAFVKANQPLNSGIRSRELSFEFVLEFGYQTQLRNAIPINNAEELYTMEAGKDYRLINDIYLPAHTPINTEVASLDGNGKTIYITGFAMGPDTPGDLALGLFGIVPANTLLMNLNVQYCSGVVNPRGVTSYYSLDDNSPATVEDYENDISRNSYYRVTTYQPINTSLDLTFNALTGGRFGGIAARNQGIITNAEVCGKVRIFTPAGTNILTSGGLVAVNDGYITNSKVKNFDIVANGGSLGGVVGINNARISSTYSDGIRLENNSQSGFTAGFVYQNTATGVINKSFAQGSRLSEDNGIRNSGGGIQSAISNSGFVYLNSGTINDSYANIILSHNSSLAGFVFNNQNGGVINNCYSTPTAALNTAGPGQANDASAFTGVSGGTVLNQGTITNCFYLDPGTEFTSFVNERAVKLGTSEFSAMSSFPGFNIAQNMDGDTGYGYTEGYTWYMTAGKPQLVFMLSPTTSEWIYKNREPKPSQEKIWDSGISVSNATTAGIYSASAGPVSDFVEVQYRFERAQRVVKNPDGSPVLDINNIPVLENIPANGSGFVALKIVSASYGTGINQTKNINIDLDINNNYDIYIWVDPSSATPATAVRLIQYNVPEYVEYHYIEKTGTPKYGDKENPRVVYNVESYNYEFNKVMNSSGTRQYVRFIADTDFNMAPKSAVTALAQNGVQNTVIEGNNMWISNIVLTYTSQTVTNKAFGLFSEFNNVLASDLNLSIIEIKSSSHYFVGGLVGFASGKTYINNVRVETYTGGNSGSNVLTPYLVLGRNLVGGVVGYAVDNFRIENINAAINVSSTYILGGTNSKYVYEPLTYNGSGKIISKTIEVSYAGAVVGVLDTNAINVGGDGFGTVANARNITVSGQTRVAGRTAGGVFGLVGSATYIRDINYVLETGSVQYVHANNYGGGLVGENRGKMTNSSIRYPDNVQMQIDSAVAQTNPVGGTTGNRQFFANGSVSVTAIGGLVGFNNDGIILDCASSLDVRNSFASVAGGAVGRMMSGQIERVTTSGSVLAGAVIGGLVGNIVSYYRAVIDTIGVFDQSQASQFRILTNINKLSPIIRDCVVATNFLNGDFNTLRLSYDVARVTGGLFGTITTLGLDAGAGSAEDDVVKTDEITGNYYVNSLYNVIAPSASSAADRIVYLGYQSSYLDVPSMGQATGDAARTYPNQMIVPSEWTTIEGYDTGTGTYVNIVGANNIGRSHFELRRGNETVYSEATGTYTDRRDTNSDTIYDEFDYGFVKQFMTNGDDINTENARLAANSYKDLMDSLFENGQATDNPGNSVAVSHWTSSVVEVRTGGGTGAVIRYDVSITLQTDKQLAGNTIKSLSTSFKMGTRNGILIAAPYEFGAYNNFAANIWNKSQMLYYVGTTSFMVLPKVIPNSQISVWTEFTAVPTINAGVYEIKTAEQLAWVAQQVNSGANSFSGITIKLMNSIDLSGRYWVPIGKDSAHAFKGVFDGNGYSVQYATVDNNSLSVAGMPSTETMPIAGVFGFVTNSGVDAGIVVPNSGIIKNLTVQGGIIRGYIAGGVVGYASYSVEVINCENRSTVVGVFAAGGVVGYSPDRTTNSSAINSVRNYGEVRLDNQSLGSGDFNNAVIYNKLAGVLPADLTDEFISVQEYRVPNEPTNANDYYIGVVKLYAGGLAGKIASIDSAQEPGKGASRNWGRVAVLDTLTNYIFSVPNINGTENINHIRASLYVGGLAGFAEGMSSNYGDYRINYGSVSVASNAHILSVGGIFGELEGSSATMSQNLGSVTVAYQNAQVTPNDGLPGSYTLSYQTNWVSDFAVGGIAGRLFDAAISLSGNFSKIDVSDVFSNYAIGGVGGVVGKMYPGSTISTLFNTNTVGARAATQATTMGVGGVVGLVMGGDIGLGGRQPYSSDPALIENSYNTGKVSSDNKAVVFMGGVTGSVIYEITKSINRDAILYNIGDETKDFESALGSAGNFAYGKDVDLSEQPEHFILQLRNTYNAGEVSVDAQAARNILGGLVGYDSNIEYIQAEVSPGIYEPTNFYLTSSYGDAGAYRIMNPGGSSVIREIVDPLFADAKTSEGLKLTVIKNELFEDNGSGNNIWGKKVPTWYPTLISNDTELYHQDYREAFVAYEANVYYIYNAEQLAQLSYMVNTGRIDTAGLTFKLMSNIDLSNKYFAPIGTQSNPFKGTFDGNKYQISSLTVDGEKSDITGAITQDGHRYGALFGFVRGADIKNVSLLGPTIFNVEYAAGIVFEAVNSTIQFVYTEQYKPDYVGQRWGEIVAGAVYTSPNAKTGLVAAGIVGRAINSTVENSYNNVPVTISEPTNVGYYDVFNGALQRQAVAGGVVGVLERNSADPSVTAALRNTYNSVSGKVTNAFLNNIGVTDTDFTVNAVDIMAVIGQIRYDTVNNPTDNPTNTLSKIIIQNNYNVADFADNTGVIPALLKVIDAVQSGMVMVYIHNNPTALLEANFYDVIDGLSDDFGFNFVDIWSGEYSLNEVSRFPSLRGLGEHWVNTESEPMELKNRLGQVRSEASISENVFNVYEISSAEELAWVASGINNGTLSSSGFVFKLTTSIDLAGRYFTPIGTLGYPFRGEFDFNGNTINNMIIDSSEMVYGGLFGYVLGNSRNGNDGIAKTEIKNGRLENAFVKLNNNSAERAIYAGALVARGVNVTIRNIDITTNIYAITGGTTEVYAGGMAGSLRYDYNQIINGVTVTGRSEGLRLDTITEGRLSEYGTADYNKDGTVDYDNIGLAAVSTGGGAYAGGLVGWIIRNYPDSSAFKSNEIVAGIRNIETDINILGMNQNLLSNVSFDMYAGGVVGYSTAQVISNVKALGSIKTFANIIDEEYAGGIIGYMVNTLLNNAYKDGGYIEGSLSLSNINSSYIGGIVACARDSIMGFTVNTARTGVDSDSVTLSKRSSGGIFGYAWADPSRGNTLETARYDKDNNGIKETDVSHVYWKDSIDLTTFQKGFGYCLGVTADTIGENSIHIYATNSFAQYDLETVWGFDPAEWQVVDTQTLSLSINRSISINNFAGVSIFVGDPYGISVLPYSAGGVILQGQYIYFVLTSEMAGNIGDLYLNGVQVNSINIINVTVSGSSLSLGGSGSALMIEVTGYYDYEIVYRG